VDKPAFYNNKSLERALQILGSFNSDRPVFALADLRRLSRCRKVTVLRLCSTLVQYDFLRFDKETKKYSLGSSCLNWAASFRVLFTERGSPPFPDQSGKQIGQDRLSRILQDSELVYIDKRENAQNRSVRLHIGTRRPPYFGMLGNLLMAYLPENEVTELLRKHPLAASTRRSVIDERVFRERLAVIRSRVPRRRRRSHRGDHRCGGAGSQFHRRSRSRHRVGFISSSEDGRGSSGSSERP